MMSMSAGDFVDVYGRSQYANSFDCVATCFFMDCSHNIIESIQIIHRILKVKLLSINIAFARACSLSKRCLCPALRLYTQDRLCKIIAHI